MKICFIADFRSPIARNWIRHFPPRGHDVHVISTMPVRDRVPDVAVHQLGNAARKSARQIRSFVDPNAFSGKFAFRMRDSYVQPVECLLRARTVRRMLDEIQPHIVHALRIPIEGELATLAAYQPFIVSIWGNDLTLFAARCLFHRKMTEQLVSSVSGLLADSTADLNRASDWGLPGWVPTLRVPGCGGIDRQVFFAAPPEPHIRAMLGIPHDATVVVNPRGYRRYIRNDTFLESANDLLSRLRNLVLVGVGLQGWPTAENFIKRNRLEGRLILTGQLSQPDLASLYRCSIASISPAEHDGTPNTLLEAMACGALPIAGSLPSIREWIRDGENGLLFDPGDAASLTQAIVRALDDCALRDRSRSVNFGLVRECADYDRNMRQAEDFYRDVIANQARQTAAIATGNTTRVYFDALSTTWERHYDPDGSMTKRCERIVAAMRKHLPPGSRILDFGCGTADVSSACASAGFEVVAVDQSAKMIDRARSRFDSEKLKFEVISSDSEALPYAAGSFDAVLASSVLEYVSDPLAYFREFHRVCRPGGYLLFTVPNLANPIRWLETIERRLITDSPDRLRLDRAAYLRYSKNRFRQGKWVELMSQAGWAVREIRGRNLTLTLFIGGDDPRLTSLRREQELETNLVRSIQ